jgi:predicted N-acetyltransferase YhbS
VGWPHPPTPAAHLQILANSQHVIFAEDHETREIVGFVTAISDGVWAAAIPLLEVKPAWQHQGIGSELMRRMLAKLQHCYMVDLLCDPELVSFYERLGMQAASGACMRRFDHQAGEHLLTR